MRRLVLIPALAMSLAGIFYGGGSEGWAQENATPFKLAFPLACTLGQTCWIQNYVDRDPSPAARDYTCGTLTYDAHNGTDIRIADMAAEKAGVNVLAAADGKVLRLREGVEDISVRAHGLKSVEGIECGNGLVIDHGSGWQTQYCHMAKGSLVVKPGEKVKSGQPLGHVGLSGETEFPHLHISVWHNGVVIDPFAPEPASGASCGRGKSVWRQTPLYTPRAVINAGFAAKPVDMAAIETGGIVPPDGAAPYVVAFVRTIGLKAGDQPSLVLFGPGGETLAPSPPTTVPGNEAQRFLLVGKRRSAQVWPKGVYRARYEVRAQGKLVLQKNFDVSITPG